MKWCILGLAILLFLPFYVFVLSKSATMGRIQAMKDLGERLLTKHKSKEELTDGKKEK